MCVTLISEAGPMSKRGFGLLALATLAAGAWVGLAREEKATLPDDLARVPAKARAIVSVRVADAWNNELVKELRKAMGRQEKELLDAIGTGGFVPEQLERVTVATTSLTKNEPLVFLRSTKK